VVHRRQILAWEVYFLFLWVVLSLVCLLELAIIGFALRMKIHSEIPRNIVGTRAAEIFWTLLPALLVAYMVVTSYRVAEAD
jgi:heme/copper-type cytochrome/quinol oxidase subunit 2